MMRDKGIFIKAALKLALSIYLGIFLGLCGVWLVNLGRHVIRLNQLVQEVPSELNLAKADSLVSLVEEVAVEVNAIKEQVEPLFPVLKALEGIARQPEAADDIRTTLIVAMALLESTAIYALLVVLILIFANPLLERFFSTGG